jgi:hypothetical protein
MIIASKILPSMRDSKRQRHSSPGRLILACPGLLQPASSGGASSPPTRHPFVPATLCEAILYTICSADRSLFLEVRTDCQNDKAGAQLLDVEHHLGNHGRVGSGIDQVKRCLCILEPTIPQSRDLFCACSQV